MTETSFQQIINVKECKMKGHGYCPKPVEQIMTFLNKKWTPTIIVTIGNFGTLRFNNLLKRIGNITQKTLSERLKELEKHNIIVRLSEKSQCVEYFLTPKGQKVRKGLLPLLELAESES